jgi:putative ABC transport system permease protein
MMFVLRMAWRETRASWGRLLFFFLCVALGVAAIVVLRSVVQQVRYTLTREARAMVGADMVVQTTRPWPDALVPRIDALLSGPEVREQMHMIETQTMARSPDDRGSGIAKLVEVRAVEAPFPFYGAIEIDGGKPYSHALLAGGGVLVQPEVLVDFGLAVGDPLIVAGRPFTIRGVVTKDRVQQSTGIAFGPRIYLDLADLRALKIVGFGSRATYLRMLRVDEAAVVQLEARTRAALRNDLVNVRSWRRLEDRLGRSLTMAENYLSLVGFAIVVLGGIGVWSVTRVIVQQKMRSVAILKCVGATSGRVLSTYVLQVLWLAAGGCVLGVGLAAIGIAAIPPSVLASLQVASVSLTASAAIQGVAVGLLVSLLFAVVPLLEVRRVKPLLLLRADTMTSARKRDWQSVLAGTVTGAGLVLVAMWQAGSFSAGLYVSVGLAVVSAALYVASRLLVRAVAPLARTRRFALRHAVISLGRPGNQTRVILMTVGLGCFFILGVRALQTNLLTEFTDQVGENWPDLVLIDIQRDQVEDVRAILAPQVRQPPTLLPQLRARVVGVDGRRVTAATREDVQELGRIGREYSLTYREALAANETVTAGVFWNAPLASARTPDGLDTEVSIAREMHEEVGIDVGDEIRFDLAGLVLRTRVTSIRDVVWSDEQSGGFVFVLRPGPAVDRTPHTFMGFVQLASGARSRGEIQRALVTRHPNVTSIDVRDVLARIREVVDNASLGVTVVGVVTMVGGVLILIGAVAMTKFQRLYDTAIYRTLGASTRRVAAMVAVEYGLLGLLAGALGAAGAFVLSWALAEFLFDITWRPAPIMLTAGALVTAIAVSAVGLVASADVLLKKPLATLRRE